MDRTTATAKTQIAVYDSFEKGRLFETYIIELFNQKSFKLVRWRKSKRTSDTLTLINYSFPDLELIFEGRQQYKFAVECKWRKRFKQGKINWAKEGIYGHT